MFTNFFKKLCGSFENEDIYGTARQATYTLSEYVILLSFVKQLCSCEHT
jgi:hypothetical protein